MLNRFSLCAAKPASRGPRSAAFLAAVCGVGLFVGVSGARRARADDVQGYPKLPDLHEAVAEMLDHGYLPTFTGAVAGADGMEDRWRVLDPSFHNAPIEVSGRDLEVVLAGFASGKLDDNTAGWAEQVRHQLGNVRSGTDQFIRSQYDGVGLSQAQLTQETRQAISVRQGSRGLGDGLTDVQLGELKGGDPVLKALTFERYRDIRRSDIAASVRMTLGAERDAILLSPAEHLEDAIGTLEAAGGRRARVRAKAVRAITKEPELADLGARIKAALGVDASAELFRPVGIAGALADLGARIRAASGADAPAKLFRPVGIAGAKAAGSWSSTEPLTLHFRAIDRGRRGAGAAARDRPTTVSIRLSHHEVAVLHQILGKANQPR